MHSSAVPWGVRMTAPVVIQGLPPAVDLRSAVLAACSDALEPRGCVASDEQDVGAPAPSTLAVVMWQDGDVRRVSVALQRRDQSFRGARGVRHRDIRFADADPLVERWRAVGLVIAALVGESDASSIEPTTDDIPTAWLGVSALMGSGLDEGSFRAGVAAFGAKRLEPLPIFVSASASYAFRPVDAQGIHVRWMTVAAGGGAATTLPRVDLGVRVRLEILLDVMSADIDAPAVSAGGGEQKRLGALAGIDAVWPAGGSIGVTAGFHGRMLTGGTAIYIDQHKVGSSAWLSYAGTLGMQWSFR
jgi:hypothetical protein